MSFDRLDAQSMCSACALTSYIFSACPHYNAQVGRPYRPRPEKKRLGRGVPEGGGQVRVLAVDRWCAMDGFTPSGVR